MNLARGGKARGPAWLAMAGVVLLGGCAEMNFLTHSAKRVETRAEEVVAPRPEGLKPQTGPGYKVGNPYQVAGVWYYPSEDYDYDETGIASWYGPNFHGKYTANGELYDMNDMTAAHKTLPMPSLVRVTNLENGRSVNLKVNDRGPFVNGRVLDVSRRGAQLLGFEGKGTAKVRVQILADESRQLAAATAGRTVLASADSPITVDRMPKPAVSQEVLAPPPGAKSNQPAQPMRSLASTTPEAAPAGGTDVKPAPSPQPAIVAMVPVKDTKIYVQAGSYSQFVNADRARAALGGGARIQQALVRERDVFRVRIGPLASVDDADRALEKAIRAGYPDARIIVD